MFQLILAVLLLVAGAAGTVAASDKAVPGDALYAIDRGVESIRLQTVRHPESLARLHLNLANERLAELQTLSDKGNPDLASEVLEDFNQSLSQAVQQSPAQEDDVVVLIDSSLKTGEGLETAEARCTNPRPDGHPTGLALANRFDVQYEEVMGWFCQGFGFGEIQIAYQTAATQTEYTLEDLFAMRQQGLGWGEILQMAGLIGQGREKGDGEEALEMNDDPESNEDRCSNPEQHPRGLDLANDFDITYEDVMDRFCQGYGFGEIKLAYQISREKSIAVDEVYHLRDNGMGWGQIMQEYDLIGKSSDKPMGTGESGKPESPGKSESKPGGKPENKPGKAPKKP